MLVHDLEYSLLPCDQRFWKQREPVNQNGSQVKGCHFLSMQINTFCGNLVNLLKFEAEGREFANIFNPKGCGGGHKVPTGQEIVCHFSQDHARVTKILDFIHKHLT